MGNRLAVAGSFALAVCLSASAAPALAAPPDRVAAMLDRDRHAEALKASEAFLAHHPDNARARFLRGVALAELGRDEDAEAVFRSLAETHPEWPEPANNLAVLYARRGDYQTARRWLERALGTRPAYATAHANLGDVYAALAAAAYRKALDGEAADRHAVAVRLDLVPRLYAASPEGSPDAGGAARTAAERADSTPADAAARKAVMAVVRRWRRAWANQDVEAYLDTYAAAFEPQGGRSRAEWQALRRKRLTTPERIEIRIDDSDVVLLDASRARATFEQHYRADNYADRVLKTLTLARTGEGWRIVRETDRPLPQP